MSFMNEYGSITWPLKSFTISSDFKSSGPLQLLLDRGNSEFGLIHQIEPGIAIVEQFPDTDEPVFFQVSKARAVCTRSNNTCKKVCVLMQHLQIDLHFTNGIDATGFLHMLSRLATKVGNFHFEVHEAASNQAIGRADFSMEKEGYTNQSQQDWMAVPDENMSEWARIYKTGKCSDFSIIARGRVFPAHRVLLCTRSQYFNVVCDGNFAESEQRSITLPEDDQTVSTMLQEMYQVYNPITGSIFTNFALQSEPEKGLIMFNLLDLFIACDKYSLESIKQKAAEAIIDRLQFIHKPLNLVDLASYIYSDVCPGVDHGLCKAIIIQLHARLPAIMENEDVWRVYAENKLLLKALHSYQYEMNDTTRPLGMSTPPASPSKRGR